eukprot:m.482359 g.482359  ORF g.482359 m.482359 type:complete len:1115 (-) comp22525_c0_seq1:182-3526(-)
MMEGTSLLVLLLLAATPAMRCEQLRQNNNSNSNVGDLAVTVVVAIAHDAGRRAELHHLFVNVSDPEHERFLQHYPDKDDLGRRYLTPPQPTVDRVFRWLVDHVAPRDDQGRWDDATVELSPWQDLVLVHGAPVHRVEAAFDTSCRCLSESTAQDACLEIACDWLNIPVGLEGSIVHAAIRGKRSGATAAGLTSPARRAAAGQPALVPRHRSARAQQPDEDRERQLYEQWLALSASGASQDGVQDGVGIPWSIAPALETDVQPYHWATFPPAGAAVVDTSASRYFSRFTVAFPVSCFSDPWPSTLLPTALPLSGGVVSPVLTANVTHPCIHAGDDRPLDGFSIRVAAHSRGDHRYLNFTTRRQPRSFWEKSCTIGVFKVPLLQKQCLPHDPDFECSKLDAPQVAMPFCLVSVEGIPLTYYESMSVSVTQQFTDGDGTAVDGAVFEVQLPVLSSTGPAAPQRVKVAGVDATTPPDMKEFYNVPSDALVCDDRATQAFSTPMPPGEYNYALLDLARFYKEFNNVSEAFVSALDVNASSNPQLSLAGQQLLTDNGLQQQPVANNANNLGSVEPTLDIQWLSAMGLGAKTVALHGGYFVAAPGPAPASAAPEFEALGDCEHNQFACLLDIVIAVEYMTTAAPRVLSTSYAWPMVLGTESEAIYEFFEGHFELLGTHGVTLTVASGDWGARTFEFKSQSHQDFCGPFAPLWPAASPSVTTVGGTSIDLVSVPPRSHPQPCARTFGEHRPCVGETASTTAEQSAGITSGGGFSLYKARPDYQNTAVQGFLTHFAADSDASAAHADATFQATKTFRGYPDIALNANHLAVVYNGNTEQGVGTSIASPMFAGMVSLINDALFRAGATTSVGHISPILYKAAAERPDVFFDVTSGSNACVVREGGNYGAGRFCCATGYPTAAGWDPVSGLGSVNFQKLADYVLQTVLKDASASFQPGPCTPATRACQLACSGNCSSDGVCTPAPPPGPAATNCGAGTRANGPQCVPDCTGATPPCSGSGRDCGPSTKLDGPSGQCIPDCAMSGAATCPGCNSGPSPSPSPSSSSSSSSGLSPGGVAAVVLSAVLACVAVVIGVREREMNAALRIKKTSASYVQLADSTSEDSFL